MLRIVLPGSPRGREACYKRFRKPSSAMHRRESITQFLPRSCAALSARLPDCSGQWLLGVSTSRNRGASACVEECGECHVYPPTKTKSARHRSSEGGGPAWRSQIPSDCNLARVALAKAPAGINTDIHQRATTVCRSFEWRPCPRKQPAKTSKELCHARTSRTSLC